MINKVRIINGRNDSVVGTKVTKASELQPGKIKVKGTAGPVDDGSTLLSPINRDEALATKVKVEERVSESWNTIYENKESVPFIIDDGTGKVRVDPPSSDRDVQKKVFDGDFVEISANPPTPASEKQNSWSIDMTRNEYYGDVSESLRPPEWLQDYVEYQERPEEVENFIEREEEIEEDDALTNKKRRYSEGIVEPGDDVYILGRAREENAGWGESDYVIDEPTESGEFVMSNKPEEQLTKEDGQEVRGLYVRGGLALFVGVFFMWVFFLML